MPPAITKATDEGSGTFEVLAGVTSILSIAASTDGEKTNEVRLFQSNENVSASVIPLNVIDWELPFVKPPVTVMSVGGNIDDAKTNLPIMTVVTSKGAGPVIVIVLRNLGASPSAPWKASALVLSPSIAPDWISESELSGVKV